MKLYLLDSSEDMWYEITYTKYFEEDMSITDLKDIYLHITGDIFVQDLLDKMERDRLIKSSLTDEEREEEKQNWDKYRYTRDYLKNVLQSKMSIIEFKTFIKWCDKEIRNRANKTEK